jgi:hypothetical protein
LFRVERGEGGIEMLIFRLRLMFMFEMKMLLLL